MFGYLPKVYLRVKFGLETQFCRSFSLAYFNELHREANQNILFINYFKKWFENY